MQDIIYQKKPLVKPKHRPGWIDSINLYIRSHRADNFNIVGKIEIFDPHFSVGYDLISEADDYVDILCKI